MTTIDTRLVDSELRAIINASQGAKKKLKEVLGAIENGYRINWRWMANSLDSN